MNVKSKCLQIGTYSIAIASAGAIALGATFAAPVQAQTVLSGYTTGGGDMDGMEVVVQFLDGSFEEAIWGTRGFNAGGAFGTNWDLTFSSWTTFNYPWTLKVDNPLAITSLSINGIPGNTVFDDGSWPSTPGSADGWSFETTFGQAPDNWQYAVPIDISTGDIWGNLSMNWSDGFTGTMKFIADTDNGTISNPVTPADVPEPASILGLLMAGALGATSLKRKGKENN
jgi:hypothetical protein